MDKVILAYSGGLDTSVAIKWLHETYNLEVICVTVDVGNERDFESIQEKALRTGAVKAYVHDAKNDFVKYFVFPSLQAGTIYEGQYPLATALARPLIAKIMVDYARGEGATHVAHGCTGKGNNQVRFDVSFNSLAPDLKIVAPVREWRWTREEEMRYSSTRAASKMEFRDGVTKDGRIVARKVRALHDAGAYHRHSPYGVQKHMANLPGPYAIPNVWIDCYCVYTNRQPSSAMRGFAVTEATFAVEVQMEKIARTIGMDSWEIRLINAYRNGTLKPVRKVMEDATLIETIQAAAALVGHELPERLKAMHSNDAEH